MYLEKNNLFYQAIPKNASTFVTAHLSELGWAHSIDGNIPENLTIFVILRDPYQRYISGIIDEIQKIPTSLKKQIISNIMANNNWFLDWLAHFNTFNLGPSTNLQIINYKVNKPNGNNNTVFFNLDDQFNLKLHNWLVEQGISNNFLNLLPLNVRKTSTLYSKINQYFTNNHISNRKLMSYLKPDYEFINSINFN